MVSSAVVAVVLVITVVAAIAADPAAPCRSTLIPAYVPPAQLSGLADDPGAGRTVILNPASGPGSGADAAYRRATRRAREAGVKVLGYVPTGYGARDPAAVRADIDRYESWYGVDGIFLDETAHDAAQLGYYKSLSGVIHRAGERTVAINPGVVPARGYFDVADIVVTYEGPYAGYAEARRKMPGWVKDVPRSRIAHLVYGATGNQAERVVAADAHAGHVYVTNGMLPHPWGALPPYLSEEERSLATCS
jgi:Spherulation-specific family 4